MTQIGQQTNKRWKLIPVSGPNTGQWLVRLQLYIPSVISTPLWRQEVYHCNTTSYIATLQTQCSDTMALQKWSYIVCSAKTLSNHPILYWGTHKSPALPLTLVSRLGDTTKATGRLMRRPRCPQPRCARVQGWDPNWGCEGPSTMSPGPRAGPWWPPADLLLPPASHSLQSQCLGTRTSTSAMRDRGFSSRVYTAVFVSSACNGRTVEYSIVENIYNHYEHYRQ